MNKNERIFIILFDSKVTYEARFVGDHEFIVTSVKLFDCGLRNKRKNPKGVKGILKRIQSLKNTLGWPPPGIDNYQNFVICSLLP
jgi:hypothetical protein